MPLIINLIFYFITDLTPIIVSRFPSMMTSSSSIAGINYCRMCFVIYTSSVVGGLFLAAVSAVLPKSGATRRIKKSEFAADHQNNKKFSLNF
jgi:hypothetical protein